MTIIEVDIADLLADPANVRRHSDRQIDMLAASLTRFGQTLPLLLRQDAKTLIAGHARLAAMQRLGWAKAKAIKSDLGDVAATAYGIADNRLGDAEVGSTFDPDGLADLLRALGSEDDFDPGALGFTPDELASMTAAPDVAEATAPEAFPEYDESIDVEHECPKCGYVWSGSSAPKGAA